MLPTDRQDFLRARKARLQHRIALGRSRCAAAGRRIGETADELHHWRERLLRWRSFASAGAALAERAGRWRHDHLANGELRSGRLGRALRWASIAARIARLAVLVLG